MIKKASGLLHFLKIEISILFVYKWPFLSISSATHSQENCGVTSHSKQQLYPGQYSQRSVEFQI